MAQYTPSFVNLSGATNALVNAYDRAAQMKYQQDQLAQKQLDDFEKNFETDKLRTQDLGAFTSAFQNYKEAALRYSRLNRGGAKPQEIAAANVLKDRAFNEIKDIYSKSTSANQLLKERSDYRKLMIQKGYTTTDDVNKEIDALSNLSVKELDLNAFTSPYDKPIYANADDYKYLNGSLNTIKPNPVDVEDKSKTKKIKIEGYGEIEVPYMVTVNGRNIGDVISLTETAIKGKPALWNTAVKEYNEFIQKLAIPETETDPVLASERELAKKKYQDIMDKTGGKYALTPALLLASNTSALTTSTKDKGLDKKYFDMIQAELKRRLSGQRLINAQKSLGLAFDKFGYLQDKDMRGLFFKAGSENIPGVAEAAAKAGVNLGDVRKAQIEDARARRKKGSNSVSPLLANLKPE
jgi:hypothetical protein